MKLLPHVIFHTGAPHLLIAFYGFAQSENAFWELKKTLKEHTLIVVQLPLLNNKIAIQKNELALQISTLIEHYHYQHATLISYSIGCRFNLCLLETIPHKISKSILIAPDGIAINHWHKLATKTWLGHIIFKYLTHSNNSFFKFATLFNRMGIIPQNLYLFSTYFMRNTQLRHTVYHTWMYVKNMTPNLKIIQKKQLENQIKLITFWGEKDNILSKKIPYRIMQLFPNSILIKINCGHQMLTKEVFEKIIPYLHS